MMLDRIIAGRLTWAAALCALLSPATVLAESRPTMLADYMGTRTSAIEAELGWYTDSQGSATLHVLAPVLSARIAAGDSMDIELDWPFGFASSSSELGDGVDEFRSGNPFLAGYYVSRQQNGYLRVGLGIAPPLASADDLDDILPLAMPTAMRGMWDAWLYVPEHLTLAVPFQIESRSGGLLLGADTAAAVLIPTGDNEGADTDLSIQLAGLVGGKRDAVSGGVRLQLVWVPTSDADNAQVAFVPFVQGDFDAGFVYLRFLVNLDEPFGVFGDGADVWAIFAGGGGRF
jgi:hypothetical protein